jgi:hypothetical protein
MFSLILLIIKEHSIISKKINKNPIDLTKIFTVGGRDKLMLFSLDRIRNKGENREN